MPGDLPAPCSCGPELRWEEASPAPPGHLQPDTRLSKTSHRPSPPKQLPNHLWDSLAAAECSLSVSCAVGGPAELCGTVTRNGFI